MKFEVHYKEKFYFALMLLISLSAYGTLFYKLFTGAFSFSGITTIYAIYIPVIILFSLFGSIFIVGFLKGNAIKISINQFPDIYKILEAHSKRLGLQKVPDMYLLQGNGVLNAFATRFAKRNFVVLYSDLLELAYKEGMDAVSFIIGHELGHIKRNHVGFFKHLILLPAKFIPFLNVAYSRACEYTCDNIGYQLSHKGNVKGMLILMAGKSLYRKINVDQLIDNIENNAGFTLWFSEIWASHPPLIKRIAAINNLTINDLNLVNDLNQEELNFVKTKLNDGNKEIRQ